MKSKRILTIGLCALGATAILTLGQAPTPVPVTSNAAARAAGTGPGIQANQDSKEPAVLATCKVPPPARGGARGGGQAAAKKGPVNPMPPDREYTVTEIPGVIAAGQRWKEVWQDIGNDADGIIATKDGGVMFAQNDKSDVVKLDKNNKASVVYTDTNTGGAISMNTKGALFLVSRGVNEAILELAPQRKIFANKMPNGDPLDCIGGVINDLTADSKGGVYFTFGGLYYADPKGVITKYGENLTTNGIVLSADEKTLYVTNGMTLAAFDVQKDGSLTNQREFAKLEGGGGGDGSTIDSMGRIYVSGGPGVQVISPEGKYLGLIPTPHGLITVVFSGPDKKTLYAVTNAREGDLNVNPVRIITIPMIAQGPKGRYK